jgi:hypothetical protein
MTTAPMDQVLRNAFLCGVSEAFPKRYAGMCETVFSNGSFSFIDVIDYLLEAIGPANVDVCAWVANSRDVRKIDAALKGMRINKFRFIFDRVFVHKHQKLYERLVKDNGPDCIRFTLTHAKFAMIYNEKADFVIETSANLNRNPRIEIFRITENRVYREFFNSFYDRFFAQPLDESKNMPISVGFPDGL